MDTILLTGGLGYIGSKFVEKYQNNYKFLILDTGYFSKERVNSENIKFVDIRNLKRVYLEKIDIVVHMGELSNDPLGNLDSGLTNEINHLATIELLELANKSSVRKFIYMSSASVYGFSDTIVDENSDVNPLTEYAKAKFNNEKYIIDNEFNFQTIILRNSTAFGFSANLRLDLVVNDLTYSGVFNKKIELFSDGTPKRPIVHISDISSFIDILIRDKRNLDKEIFNVGDKDMNFSIREIAETVGKVLGVDNLIFGEPDKDQRSYFLNFDKTRNFFPDFEIEFDLVRGVEDLYENLKGYQLNGNEKRLSKINKLIETDKLDKNLYWL
jgi:nucleoside-diphosphate-sugar epimerase